jgi:hypothetical protein
MSKCDNCSSEFDPSTAGLQTTQAGRVIASVCDTCCGNVRVGKIVLRRADVGDFAYEQWSPMEMMRGGLTSKKAR